MRQVSRDQLIQTLNFQIKRVGPSTWKMLGSHDDTVRSRGANMIATALVDKALRQFEILINTPPPPTEQADYTVNGLAEHTPSACTPPEV